jgi:lipopolysaccharide transport system permease protein
VAQQRIVRERGESQAAWFAALPVFVQSMATTITARSERVLRYLNPIAMAHNLWRHRDLIRQFTRREVEGRYKGSFLGLFWSFVNPLVLLLIYTFVFGVVFKARWPNARTDNLGEFAITLFCGLITFTVFSECVGRAPALVVGVPNYVKKVVFPLEILPVSTLGAALFHAGVSLAILLAANLLMSGTLPWTLVFVPLVALPLICLSLGLTWFLSSLGVFIRDIGYTVALIVQALFFLTPIFYAVENIPEPYRTIIGLNPLTPIVESARRVILWGLPPLWDSLAIALVADGAIMLLGYAWFMKTKKAFADVI